MENGRTGALIRELRKERGLTQEELARQLHLTGAAVSKWERGLSAPDLSVLEPLARVLGTTVTELLSGERAQQGESLVQIEKNVQNAISYSVVELTHKTGVLRRRYFLAAVLCALCAALLCLAVLWWNGTFNLVEKLPSPNGAQTLLVYDRDMFRLDLSGAPSVSVLLRGEREVNVTYGSSVYRGIWWSPDSKRYVVALEQEGNAMLALANLETSTESNLNAYLSMAVENSSLREYGFRDRNGWPDVGYQFLQWSTDGSAMLICYDFVDTRGQYRSGYFWYHPDEGVISALLELEPM